MMFTSSILGRTNRCLRLCNTVPIEKGTETLEAIVNPHSARRCNTVPIEKGTETVLRVPARLDPNFHRAQQSTAALAGFFGCLVGNGQLVKVI